MEGIVLLSVKQGGTELLTLNATSNPEVDYLRRFVGGPSMGHAIRLLWRRGSPAHKEVVDKAIGEAFSAVDNTKSLSTT